ncbi:hypothetical protein HOY80DRAFT_865484, partial [Tuber brumale]
IDNCLTYYHDYHPDLFRQQAHMLPLAFDTLLEILRPISCFNTKSTTLQLQIEKQLLVTLKRLGNYGNGASLSNLAQWAGIGEGTVDKVTRRVLKAVLQIGLLNSQCREKAQQMVESKVIPELRGGWCIIDETLIPLFMKPYYFGEHFF